ncbi:MAG: hypothetical protein H6899_15910 [Rhodobacter sp.]|nr:hypothetical protein [Rhodobacter sp.]
MKTLLLSAAVALATASAAFAASGPGSPSPTPPGTSPVPSVSFNNTPGSFLTVTLLNNGTWQVNITNLNAN